MNKEDALKRIEELREFIDSIDSFKIQMVEVKNLTSNPFNIGIYPVTNEQYRFIFPNHEPDKADNLPVVNVSWDDCQEYIKLLNEKTGRNFALPTEHQWLVCATINGTIYSGSNDIRNVAWHKDNCDKLQLVGLILSNSLGIYDMSGNVWEWCKDSYQSSHRVLRGGSWGSSADYCRVSYRGHGLPNFRSDSRGFRLVENF